MRRIRGGPTACPRNVLRNDKLDVPTFDIMSVRLAFALLAFIEILLSCIFGIRRGRTQVCKNGLESWIADLGNSRLAEERAGLRAPLEEILYLLKPSTGPAGPPHRLGFSRRREKERSRDRAIS